MPYLELPGGPSYHEVSGEGEALVLLHGGYCSLEVMRELGDHLATSYRVHAPERPGHGRTKDEPGPFSYQAMAAHTIAYLDAVGLERAHFVGFSDGANAGLLLARDHPERTSSLIAISGNLDPGAFVTGEEAAMSSTAEQHRQTEQEYARLSPDGAVHASVILGKLGELWTTQPQIAPASLATVAAPTLVMAGDRDMIALEHTALIRRSIPGAQLAIVPGAGHLLVRERPALIATLIREFLAAKG